MTPVCWWMVDAASGMLDADERDAVRGDIAESGETAAQALRDVLGLVARRKTAPWRDWRPWVALAVLVSLGIVLWAVAMHVSYTSAVYLWMYLDNWDWRMAQFVGPGFWRMLGQSGADISLSYLTLICWSWTGGLAIGSLSRRAAGINGFLFGLILLSGGLWRGTGHRNPGNDAVFSLTFYSVIFPLIVQASLVLLPAFWGMQQGRRLGRFPLAMRAIVWTAAIASMIPLATAGRLGRPRPPVVAGLVGPIAYLAMIAFAGRRRHPVKENHI